MRVLVDILHPAHVHFFRNLRDELLAAGHDVVVTARDKDLTLTLLDRYGIPADVLSAQRTGRIGLARELLTRVRRLRKIVRATEPDVLIGIMGPAIAPVGRLTRTPSLVFYDTEHATQTNRWVYPMATRVITPECYDAPLRANQVTYPGYHELAYLHPDRFTPDPGALQRAGIEPGTPFGIVRFVSLVASHDIGATGIDEEAGRALISHLETRGEVLISSERPLPPDLEARRIASPPEDAHSLMAYAQIVVGESATMCSEAAVLGTPGIHISNLPLGYVLDQQDRYELTRYFRLEELADVPAAIDAMLAVDPEVWQSRRSNLLDQTIDPTRWMLDFITNRRWEEPIRAPR